MRGVPAHSSSVEALTREIMTHCIREEMYSLEGMIVRPCSSTAFSSLNTDNTVAMLRYKHEIAICLPGQILEQEKQMSLTWSA